MFEDPVRGDSDATLTPSAVGVGLVQSLGSTYAPRTIEGQGRRRGDYAHTLVHSEGREGPGHRGGGQGLD